MDGLIDFTISYLLSTISIVGFVLALKVLQVNKSSCKEI